MIFPAEQGVGHAVVDHVHQDVEIHAADGLVQNTLSFACSEAGQTALHNVGRTLISREGQAVFVLTLALCAPVNQILVDFLAHLPASGQRDQPETSDRNALKCTFVMSSGSFHGVPHFQNLLHKKS